VGWIHLAQDRDLWRALSAIPVGNWGIMFSAGSATISTILLVNLMPHYIDPLKYMIMSCCHPFGVPYQQLRKANFCWNSTPRIWCIKRSLCGATVVNSRTLLNKIVIIIKLDIIRQEHVFRTWHNKQTITLL